MIIIIILNFYYLSIIVLFVHAYYMSLFPDINIKTLFIRLNFNIITVNDLRTF